MAASPRRSSSTGTNSGDAAYNPLLVLPPGLPADNFCTVQPVRLAGKGLESAVALELRDRRPAEDRVGPCRVTVAAPHGYQLSVVLVNKATTASSPVTSPSSAPSASDVASDEVPTSEPSCRLSLVRTRTG